MTYLRILSFDRNNQLLDIAEPILKANGKFFKRAMRDRNVMWVRVQRADCCSIAFGRTIYLDPFRGDTK